ncbi:MULTISPECIES: type I-E CRISPR-associated protein Cas6/Cse3/CasE [Enterobacterales]|uniref:type I-E CRISPR-associated protein Cas6/Cse3/CasE n=1 Tax=Enterobacterales TaxID=91347 RepID=UPI002EDB0B52
MTLYLSALHLNSAACRKQKITDVYSLHRVVYDLFDDVRTEHQKQASVPSGIQWVDKGGDVRGRRLLILSDRSPNQPEYGELQTKVLPDHFLLHKQYRFSVCLNPASRDTKTHKLTPVRGREAIGAWFCQRTAAWGIEVDPRQLQVEDITLLQVDAGIHKYITLQQATLSGRLTVVDPERFKTSFTKGIGRGRAFGCGLLQIVPLTDNFFSE